MPSNFEFWITMHHFCISVFNATMHVFYLAAILGVRIAKVSWGRPMVTLFFHECRWYKSKVRRLISVPPMAWGWSQGPETSWGGEGRDRHISDTSGHSISLSTGPGTCWAFGEALLPTESKACAELEGALVRESGEWCSSWCCLWLGIRSQAIFSTYRPCFL